MKGIKLINKRKIGKISMFYLNVYINCLSKYVYYIFL